MADLVEHSWFLLNFWIAFKLIQQKRSFLILGVAHTRCEASISKKKVTRGICTQQYIFQYGHLLVSTDLNNSCNALFTHESDCIETANISSEGHVWKQNENNGESEGVDLPSFCTPLT